MSVFNDADNKTIRLIGMGAVGFVALTVALAVLAIVVTV